MKQTRSEAARDRLKTDKMAAKHLINQANALAAASKLPAQVNGNGHGFIDRTMVNARLQGLQQQRAALDAQITQRIDELKQMERVRHELSGAIMALEEIAAAVPAGKANEAI